VYRGVGEAIDVDGWEGEEEEVVHVEEEQGGV
jgi:hypothetical protein